ncbi:metal-dependent hydrolase family protein [Paracandidimonas soli]|uniref:Imidazolonepropionase-like amidohydrolase n=2 Tax=Paracandidimonas soli TaxID=1917182 RepID=A0A4R3VFU6_9BURK|nr:amidohydrolase family protein [Paracandidimonas soli]TCV03121.1 imidazolonepropionase-like amidohydrolase [Paracandidimonas soli]
MQGEYIFKGGRLLVPQKDALVDGCHVHVRGGTIVAVSDQPIQAEGAQAIDLKGKTLMPGLIDGHVHIYMNERNIAALADVNPTYMAAKSTVVLRGMIMRGFTTVRDVAGGDYGMRDAVNAGYVTSPRLFVGGRAISQTGGHGDFRSRANTGYGCACCTGLSLFAAIADGLPDVIKATREELRRGADHIKIMLSGGVASPNDPLESLQYREDEISAIVEEADRWGVYTCAHAYLDDAIERGVRLGVRTIEHGNFVSDATAQLMNEKSAFLVPTLIVYQKNKELGPASGKSEESLRKNDLVLEAGLQALDTCKRNGVQIGYGSDLSMHTQQFQCDGLSLHAQALSNAEVIRSATLVNAAILRQEGKLGEIVPGAIADLLVVDGDPYQGLEIFDAEGSNLHVIMKEGEFVKNLL